MAVGDVRQVLVERLTTEIGPEVDTDDPELGWLTAHAALRTVEWVLDSCGYGPDHPLAQPAWRALALTSTVDALKAAHTQRESEWYGNDDDDGWPLPVGDYVTLIESLLDTDLAGLAVEAWRPATARFTVPTDETVIGCIRERKYFGYNDPDSWVIQRRIGLADLSQCDIEAELDRFVVHWSFKRNCPNPWLEIDRGQAIENLVRGQRTSLLWRRVPWSVPTEREARDKVDSFLYCFPRRQTRFFTNCERPGSYWFYLVTEATFDTGVVAISPGLAGIWWFAEAD